MHVDGDLAFVLTQHYNGYASMLEDMPMLEEEWVLERLQGAFFPEDLELLIDDDFGRGLIMGQLRVLKEMEQGAEDGETAERTE